MKVNKKKLAEIFNVDPRTIERWQSQGLPCVSGGGKTKATVSVSGMTITVNGVAAGKVNIPVVSGNGELAAVAEITVTDS